MSNKHQCRDCKLLLATQYDFDTIPSGEGQHLCWRQFTGDVCTGNPIEWQMRCYQAEAEITALRKEVERLGELIAGYKDTLLSVQKQHRRTQARTDAAEAALVEVMKWGHKAVSLVSQAGPLAWAYMEHTIENLEGASNWEKQAVKLIENFDILNRAEPEKGDPS